MGSLNSGYEAVTPQHRVSLQSYYIGKYEVTQAQWQAITGTNPSHFKGCGECPVESVSWNDVQGFIRRLNTKANNYTYRLPSEAEWEYACRAGTTEDYAGDLDSMAWYDANSDQKTHPVGQKQPNGFGLYDMQGNVWEWCEDVWHWDYNGAPSNGSAWLRGADPTGRVVRGGSWTQERRFVRSVSRSHYAVDGRYTTGGFRLVAVARK